MSADEEPTYTVESEWNRFRYYGVWYDGEGKLLTVTDDQIRWLREVMAAESLDAFVAEYMRACDGALAGDEEARKRCARWYYDREVFG